MTNATFTATEITINGKTFPVAYSIAPNNTVFAFVTVQEDDKPVNLRIKFEPGSEYYAEALEAAQQERQARSDAQQSEAPAEPEQPQQPEPEAEQPTEQTEAEPEQAEQEAEAPAELEQVEAPVEAEQPARDPKQARGPVPEKLFVGLEIKGTGWKILFDGSYDRTRVIFKRKPSNAAREAVEKAGFYWSPAMQSWNKKLTHKAFRAAQALALELKTICG